MTALDLDPLFVKALRLLHSKSKDSAEQLRQMLDDALNQQKHFVNKSDSTKSLFAAVKQETESMKSLTRKSSPKHLGDLQSHSVKHSFISSSEDVRKKDHIEKRPLEKLRLLDHIEPTYEAKKARLDSPQPSRSSSSSPQPLRVDDGGSSKADDDSDSTEGNADADNFAMEMGLACIVCKQIDVSPGNQLVECQECHNLYHQECHRPPATDHDVNDPRQVWYCTRCTKNMKKLATKPPKVSKSSLSLPNTKEVLTQVKVPKPDSVPQLLQPFKRAEHKVPTSQSNSGSAPNKPIGLAGLAANLSGRASGTSSSASGHSKTGSPFGKSSSSSGKPAAPFASLSLLKNLSSNGGKSSTGGGLSSSSVTSSSAVKPGSSMASAGSSSSKNIPNLLGSSSSRSASSSSGNNGSSSSGSASAGGAKAASSSSLMSADKRLQIMKKKAAAKMQEKRRLSAK